MESTVKLCDVCQRHPATEFRIWKEEESEAKAIDLCRQCSKPLTDLAKAGRVVELPTKPRQRMILTPLKTTRQTAEFKKKKKTPPKR